MKKVILKTNKLNKSFKSGTQEQQVLKNLDIEFYEGDYTVIWVHLVRENPLYFTLYREWTDRQAEQSAFLTLRLPI